MFFGMDLLQHRLLPIWLDRDVQRCLQLHWYPIDDERVRQLADLREQMLKLSLDILQHGLLSRRLDRDFQVRLYMYQHSANDERFQ
jgi:hypothetical protein